MVDRKRGRPDRSVGNAITDEKILDLVLSAFGEDGFDGTSIREIARKLNVSHNLIPQRFGTKKRLWIAAVDHGFGQLAQTLVAEGKLLGLDEMNILRGLFIKIIESHAACPALLQIVNQEASRPGPRLDYLFDTFIHPAHEFSKVWFTKLEAENRIKPTSISTIYFLIVHGAGSMFALPGLTDRLSEKSDLSSPSTIRAQAEATVDLIFDGLQIQR